MTRTRTTPASSPNITQDTIEYFFLVVPRNANGTSNTANVTMKYEVANRLADGTVVSRQVREQTLDQWSAPLQTAIETMYDALLVDATSAGLIGAGTDTDDLP